MSDMKRVRMRVLGGLDRIIHHEWVVPVLNNDICMAASGGSKLSRVLWDPPPPK